MLSRKPKPCTMEGQTARASVPIARPRVCRKAKGGCGGRFTPMRPLQAACGWECAQSMARAKREQDEAKARRESAAKDRAAREEMKPLSYYADKAQAEVNRYVRLRDACLGCISCDKGPNWGGQWHAGHLRSRGASPETRFILWAIRKQCSECNHMRGGNAAEFYRRLLPIVGIERLEWLFGSHAPKKYNREQLKRMRAIFAKKADRQQAINT